MLNCFIAFDIQLKVEPYSLSSDRRSVDALLADTLCYLDKGISANLMTRLDVQFTKVDQMLPLISKPFCTFVGEDDTLISLPSCSRLDTISSSNDKNIISYPGTRHLLHLENGETRARFIHGKKTLIDALSNGFKTCSIGWITDHQNRNQKQQKRNRDEQHLDMQIHNLWIINNMLLIFNINKYLTNRIIQMTFIASLTVFQVLSLD